MDKDTFNKYGNLLFGDGTNKRGWKKKLAIEIGYSPTSITYFSRGTKPIPTSIAVIFKLKLLVYLLEKEKNQNNKIVVPEDLYDKEMLQGYENFIIKRSNNEKI